MDEPADGRSAAAAASGSLVEVGGLAGLPPVLTCDAEEVPALSARRTARLYFWIGFACLPWFWACNCWLFWPDFVRRGGDPVVAKYTRQSALGFAAASCLFLPWMLLYLIAGQDVLGESAYADLDINRIDLSGSGLGAG